MAPKETVKGKVAAKQKAVEDKTFGLKNKNSNKVQKWVVAGSPQATMMHSCTCHHVMILPVSFQVCASPEPASEVHCSKVECGQPSQEGGWWLGLSFVRALTLFGTPLTTRTPAQDKKKDEEEVRILFSSGPERGHLICGSV